MKKSKIIITVLSLFIMPGFFVQTLSAQGYGGPLTFEGLDHYTLHSAAGRAMAGVAIGSSQDAGLMFQNAAAMSLIAGVQLSLGGVHISSDASQEQQYAPVRYYPNLSLLLEGLTDQIPDPDSTFFGFTAMDTVQRPFDDIGPDWSKSKSKLRIPLQALLAVPISFENVKLVAGIGAVQYADMGHFYQNNNVLSPSILSQRPLPTFRPTDNNPIEVEWSQTVRSRQGAIQGYGLALAANIEKLNLALGFSGLLLDGSTDDYERELSRGRLTFFSNAFRADLGTSGTAVTKIGTSEFSGQEFTLSSIISGRYVNVGISVKLPATITRKYSLSVINSAPASPDQVIEGEDELQLPLRGTAGISLSPKENLTVGIEYEFRRNESVRYVDSQGTETSPWQSAPLFRLGAEYRAATWLALRAGMRGEAAGFEPEGSQIAGEPVTYTVYSAGLGVLSSGLHLNVAYENSMMKYQDIWASAISKNRDRRHAFIAQLSYDVPWFRR